MATGCGFKEIYIFPHTTYPYSSCICTFLQQHPIPTSFFILLIKCSIHRDLCSIHRDLCTNISREYFPIVTGEKLVIYIICLTDSFMLVRSEYANLLLLLLLLMLIFILILTLLFLILLFFLLLFILTSSSSSSPYLNRMEETMNL